MGPILLGFQAGLGIEATDNVQATENNPQADLLFRPEIGRAERLAGKREEPAQPVAGRRVRVLLENVQYNNLFVSPDSDLSFDLFILDFAINFHDRFSYSQDAYSDPTTQRHGSAWRVREHGGPQCRLWDLTGRFESRLRP